MTVVSAKTLQPPQVNRQPLPQPHAIQFNTARVAVDLGSGLMARMAVTGQLQKTLASQLQRARHLVHPQHLRPRLPLACVIAPLPRLHLQLPTLLRLQPRQRQRSLLRPLRQPLQRRVNAFPHLSVAPSKESVLILTVTMRIEFFQPQRVRQQLLQQLLLQQPQRLQRLVDRPLQAQARLLIHRAVVLGDVRRDRAANWERGSMSVTLATHRYVGEANVMVSLLLVNANRAQPTRLDAAQ